MPLFWNRCSGYKRLNRPMTLIHCVFIAAFLVIASLTGPRLTRLERTGTTDSAAESVSVLREFRRAAASASYRKRFSGRDPPPNFEKWFAFATQRGCHTDLAEYAQVYRDLDPFFERGSIDPATVTDFNLSAFGVIRTGSFDRGTFTYGPRAILDGVSHLIPVDKPFKYAYRRTDYPIVLPATDGTTHNYASMKDAMDRNECLQSAPSQHKDAHGFYMDPFEFEVQNTLAPLFSQAKTPCFKDILMPVFHHSQAVRKVEDPFSWHQKRNVLFWRGSTTGGRIGASTPWRKFHRMRLLTWEKRFALQNPERVFDAGENATPPHEDFSVDVGINSISGTWRPGPKNYSEVVMREYPLKTAVSFETTLAFKYLLVIDGNTWPGRLQYYLETNSVILYAGIFIDYYMWKLEPWVHYVPVAIDFSDLDERIQWLRKNDKAARQISLNAQKFIKGVNTISAMQCYSGLVFLEYSRLYNAAGSDHVQ